MKKIIVLGLAALSMSSAFAATGHTNFAGSVDKFLSGNGVIKNEQHFEDIIKYTDVGTQLKLRAAFKDGTLTAEEIKSSGISDHHFYTGLLASARTQGEYDKILNAMNGVNGKPGNLDDLFVTNRDMKAHGSMLINQVDTKLQLQAGTQNKVDKEQDKKLDHLMEGQDAISGYVESMDKDVAANTDRLDKVVAGLQDLGNHLQAQVPTLPPVDSVDPEPVPPVENKPYDDTQVKNDIATNTGNISANSDKIEANKQNITTNSNNIQAMGDAFEQRVDVVNGYLSQAGSAIQNNTTAITDLSNAFQAQAAHTTQEIARLDGRIDQLEEKTDKLKAGIAGAHAVASLTQYTGNGTHHVAVGIGGYEGASALAGGYTYAISSQTTVRATVAYDSEGDFGFGASVGHSW